MDKEEIKEERVETTTNVNNDSKEEKPNKKNNKKRIIIVVSIILVLVLALVVYYILNNKKEAKPIKTDAKKVYSEYRMSGNGLENFDLRFLQLEANNKNIIYSPLSIKYALQMLSEGSKGETKTQIDDLIGEYKSNKYTNSSNMSFANAMFIKNSYKDSIIKNYTTNLQKKYNAEVIYDSFENPNTINSWISEKTFNLINNLMDDSVKDLDFALINALAIDMEWNKLIQATSEGENMYGVGYDHEKYSDSIEPIGDNDLDGKMDWNTVKFNNTINAEAAEIGASLNNYDIVKELGEDNIRQTISKEYQEYLADPNSCGGEEDVNKFVDKFIEELDSNYKKVDVSTDFKFHIDDNVKVFSKELKEYNGTTLEYIGIMPRNKSLDEFIKSSDAKSINEILSKIKTVEIKNVEEGKVTKIVGGIPFFKYDYELNLMKDLNSLGITNVFDSAKADLSGLSNKKDTFISQAKHKANIEFSNEGIKASAATVLGGMGAAGCGFEHLYDVPVTIIDLNFDNPYLYLIRDKNTKEVWFVGSVYEPIVNTSKYQRVIDNREHQ